ncbi:MAG TPA: hypothetical protein VF346_01770, partial [Bacteroidales bacterium]
MSKKNLLLLFLLISVFTSCKVENKKIIAALDSITSDNLKTQISIIASDDFQGRAPATKGEEKTIAYLAEQFKLLGLKPANNGSYFQEVSLLKLTADKSMKINISG